MSFFNQAIKFYPNWLNYNTSDIDGINYDPDAEPTIDTNNHTNSDGTTTDPAYDVIDGRITPVVTIDTNGEATAAAIRFDLTNNIDFDTVIAANHNFGTANCDISFDDSGTVGFSTAKNTTTYVRFPKGYYVLDEAIDVAANVATFDAGEDGIALFETDSETGETVFELDIDPTGATFAADVTVGEVIVSKKWTAPHAPETQGWVNVDQYGNEVTRTRGGQNYATLHYGLKKRITLNWKHLTSSQLSSLEEVFQVTKGSTFPMFVDLGEHATDYYLRYMRLVGDLTSVPIAGGAYHNVTLTLEEE